MNGVGFGGGVGGSVGRGVGVSVGTAVGVSVGVGVGGKVGGGVGGKVGGGVGGRVGGGVGGRVGGGVGGKVGGGVGVSVGGGSGVSVGTTVGVSVARAGATAAGLPARPAREEPRAWAAGTIRTSAATDPIAARCLRTRCDLLVDAILMSLSDGWTYEPEVDSDPRDQASGRA
jgi:hypothetical protein